MQRWKVDFEAVEGRSMPNRRWPQRQPLGIAVVGEYAHKGLNKPHAVRSVTIGRSRRTLTLEVSWLSDSYPPPRDPYALEGVRLKLDGRVDRTVVCTNVTAIATVPQRELLGEQFVDPLLPDPVGSVIDPTVEFRIRSDTPWVFARTDPAGEFHPGRMMVRLARRWNDLLVWEPDSRPGSRPTDLPDQVPPAVIDELFESTSATSISRLESGEEQVSFDRVRQRPNMEDTTVVDAVVRCAPGRFETWLWFQALVRFAVWSGIGRYTTSGLGQVSVSRVRRLSELPHAVVPQWQGW